MSVTPTSHWAYEGVDITLRQQQVIDALRALGEASDQAIADQLGWPINCVTPRRGELAEMNLVALARLGRNARGRKVQIWRLVLRQGDLFESHPRSEGARA